MARLLHAFPAIGSSPARVEEGDKRLERVSVCTRDGAFEAAAVPLQSTASQLRTMVLALYRSRELMREVLELGYSFEFVATTSFQMEPGVEAEGLGRGKTWNTGNAWAIVALAFVARRNILVIAAHRDAEAEEFNIAPMLPRTPSITLTLLLPEGLFTKPI